MAIAGSAIRAPHCTIVRGLLTVNWQTTSRDLCVPVNEAVSLLTQDKQAIVMPGDMAELRRVWERETNED